MVRVRVVRQVGVQAAGEKGAVTPAGRPETLKDTACALPETSVALMVLETEAPGLTDLPPPLDSEKVKVEVVTVRVKLVVRVTPPPVPFTVIV